jgi:DNA-binding response OmpR family regulator
MTPQVHTLVVDDEEGVRFFLQETLRRAGHVVATAASGEDALDRLRDTQFDLVVLDLKLGGRVDGLRVLETARWRWPDVVVVILTAHGSLESAMAAIREGVDGYLLKPAEPEQVRRTVEDALGRRRSSVRGQEEGEREPFLRRGPFSVELEKHLVTRDGQPLELTSREFQLLVHLMQNASRVVTPREIVRIVGRYEVEDLYEARQIVKWYIHRLRRKVEPDPGKPRYVLNVRGVGYRFEG